MFYTVDRSKRLKVGQTLCPDTDYTGRKFFPVVPHHTNEDLEAYVRDLFPAGLSIHGKQYLLDQCLVVNDPVGKPLSVCPVMPVMELVSELVRRTSFPGLPSRFTSVFAWDTKEEAATFRASHCGGAGSICRVSGKVGFRGDMNLLLLGGTILGSWLYATKYWSSARTATPRVECLLLSPVTVDEVFPE